MLVQKTRKDNLTKLELRIYGFLCYGGIICFLIFGYFISQTQINNWEVILLVISFVFLTIAAVFGFAIQNDVRVLDLRGKSKK